jgi:hypothetical protein
MKNSFFWQDKPTDIKQPVFYKEKDGKRIPCESENVPAMGPAGSIRSTITDMAQWLKFNLAKGKVDDEALLDEASFSQLWLPNINYQLLPFEVPETRNIGYSLGWFIDNYRGELRVDHGGNVSGATALVSMLPEKGIGVVVLTNQNSSVLTYALTSYIQDILLGHGEKTDWYAFWIEEFGKLKKQQEEQFETMRKAVPDKPMTHNGEEYTGKFEHPGYGEISICYDEKAEHKLSADMHGKVIPLIHMHYDVFRVEVHDIPVPVIFRTDAKGDISSVDFHMEMSLPEMVSYQRVPEPEPEEKAS